MFISGTENSVGHGCAYGGGDPWLNPPKSCSETSTAANLMTVVEVVPLVAGAAPVVVGRGVVGAVVGVLGLLIEGAGLGVLDERLGVEVSCLLAVKSGAHLDCTAETGRSATTTATHYNTPQHAQCQHQVCIALAEQMAQATAGAGRQI